MACKGQEGPVTTQLVRGAALPLYKRLPSNTLSLVLVLGVSCVM